jgi:hypothetical protein
MSNLLVLRILPSCVRTWFGNEDNLHQPPEFWYVPIHQAGSKDFHQWFNKDSDTVFQKSWEDFIVTAAVLNGPKPSIAHFIFIDASSQCKDTLKRSERK